MEGARVAQEARMRRLANQPHTDVLEYSFEEAEREASAEVCVKLAQRVVEGRQALDPSLSNAQAGRKLCADDPILTQFSRTHPRIFACMLDPAICGRSLLMLEQLARVRQDVARGEMGEAEANVHVSRLVMEKTMREPTAEEKETLVLDGESVSARQNGGEAGETHAIPPVSDAPLRQPTNNELVGLLSSGQSAEDNTPAGGSGSVTESSRSCG